MSCGNDVFEGLYIPEDIPATPEPCTMALFGLGVGAIALKRRKNGGK